MCAKARIKAELEERAKTCSTNYVPFLKANAKHSLKSHQITVQFGVYCLKPVFRLAGPVVHNICFWFKIKVARIFCLMLCCFHAALHCPRSNNGMA